MRIMELRADDSFADNLMLLQTNSYIVPKEKRAEHARLLARFRQTLARIGCDHFEAYEQVGTNWSPSETGRFVQIMRFRDRRHQQQVQAAERTDPAAQQLIREFCDLINLPYQQQQGLFAMGYYSSVMTVAPVRIGPNAQNQRQSPPQISAPQKPEATKPETPAEPPPLIREETTSKEIASARSSAEALELPPELPEIDIDEEPMIEVISPLEQTPLIDEIPEIVKPQQIREIPALAATEQFIDERPAEPRVKYADLPVDETPMQSPESDIPAIEPPLAESIEQTQRKMDMVREFDLSVETELSKAMDLSDQLDSQEQELSIEDLAALGGNGEHKHPNDPARRPERDSEQIG